MTYFAINHHSVRCNFYYFNIDLLYEYMFPCLCSRAEYDCFQIELTKNYGTVEWREDLKSVMLKAGLENKSVIFLFSDTQVKLPLLKKTIELQLKVAYRMLHIS